MTETRTVTVTFAAPLTVQLEGEPAARRTIAGLAVPFGVASGPAQDGQRYVFSTPPDNAEDLVDVVRGHDDDHVIGRLAAPFAADGAGLAATARIFGTSRGDDALVEATEGVLTGFSLSTEVADYTTDDQGVRTVGHWTARHLGIVRRPAFEQSAGLQVAASAHQPERTSTMTTTEAPPVEKLPTIAELAAEVSKALKLEQQQPAHPLAQFATFADYVHAVYAAEPAEAKRLQAAFALVDQTTTNNPGVIPPGWRSEIKMNLEAERPAIEATGGSGSLPDAGMDSNWPYFDGDLDSIIARQAAEKTELHSVEISIKKTGVPILTAGVVSDISYQLLMRSSPSYLEAYMSICRAAWARFTEYTFETALVAASTDSGITFDPAGSLGDLRGALFALSTRVRRATGIPARAVGVSTDVWEELGGNDNLYNPSYGTQNVAGTSDASQLTISVNGLAITEWPFLADGLMIATNSRAAKFTETGALTASSEDVTKLGRDVAVWGMYTPGEVYFPAGVQRAEATTTP